MLSEYQKNFNEWVVYQVYPRSFNDSNGDGIGDIPGITAKLDYLKDLGVNAVWLSPCYKSPNDDNGYDISDYCDIMDEFGTLDDWKTMIAEMHKRGIKLIMDFVANHTSSEHKWFKEAKKSKDNPYRDYYYWVDKPVNDWQATFGGSAWEYDEATNQYYLHSFAISQPDLNWENPKVQEEMIKVIDFWVDLGVDGFRCDVLDMISKDFDNDLNGNGPRLHEFINMLFGREKTKHIFTVGECWGANEENIRMLTDGTRGELSTVFQFDHVCVGQKSKFEPVPFTLDDIRDVFVKWQTVMQRNELLYTLFFENHDLPRCVSRFANDKEYRYEAATMLATMTYLQKGMPFIYQGQEIGTANSVSYDINDFRDIESLNYYNMNPHGHEKDELMRTLNYGSRDHARHPMAWNDGENSGFGGNPWIPVYNRYKEINVETDMNSDRSVHRYFKDLFAFRKGSEAICHGDYEDITDGRKGCYIYRRSTDKESFVIVCNFENENTIDINIGGKVVLSNCGRTSANGTYKPYECAVFKI